MRRKACTLPMPMSAAVRASAIGLRPRTVALAMTWICRAGNFLP